MKRHGPFLSPGHVRDHEPFYYSLGSCDPPAWIPPNRDAVWLWTALGPGLCRMAATRHLVCAVKVRDSAVLGFGGSEVQGIVSRRERANGPTRSSGTRPPPAAMASADRDAALTGDWRRQHSLKLAWDARGTTFGRTEGIGCVPMHNSLLLAELKALGVCRCRICCIWQN